MKSLLYLFAVRCLFTACSGKKLGYIFLLHNRFLEEHSTNEVHPEYGVTAYDEPFIQVLIDPYHTDHMNCDFA